jgi:hypothetical protein
MGIKDKIKKLIPGKVITYQAPQVHYNPKTKPKAPDYKVPKTPKNSGFGWGG